MTRNLLLENQLCFALYSAANAITRLYAAQLGQLGLTYPQYLALLVLWERDDRPVHEIGRALRLDSGTLTPLLKRLEKAGWVTRRRDPEDERVVRIALTAAGHRIETDVAALQEQVACRTGLPEDEFNDLKSRLQELTRSMVKNQGGVKDAA